MPAKKIDFKVVYASAENEKLPSSDLNSDRHGPLIQGWASEKFCPYPIELVIQFCKKIRLKKVQLLSHQFLIATKIEFFIGDVHVKNPQRRSKEERILEEGIYESNDQIDINENDSDLNYEKAKYTRLGYVELSSNERTDFRARELKSVHVDAEGTFLKLVLHKNFVNKLNQFNQVGIVAINIIGNDLEDDDYLHSNRVDHNTDPAVLAVVKRPDYISPLDDLAFAMYQDQEISSIIIDLDKKKTECVLNEKYDEAKKLKITISELYKIGERLARYDIEKRQALEEEDYERAKLKKYQIQEYRAETYKQLQANNLLGYIDSEERRESVIRKSSKSYYKLNRDSNKYEYDQNNYDENYEDETSNLKEDKISPRDNSPPQYAKSLNTARKEHKEIQQVVSPRSNRYSDNSDVMVKPSTPYDKRVIPTLRNTTNKSRLDKPTDNQHEERQRQSHQSSMRVHEEEPNESVVLDPTNNAAESMEPETYDPMDGTEEMTEREVREAALMNDFLGKQIVTKLYSKNFQNREDAITEVHTNLQNYKGDKEEARAIFRAAAILVAKMCKDNVFSIFSNSIKMLDFLVKNFAKTHQIGKQDINYLLEKVLPVLLHRTGDTNARLRQRAHEYTVEMASFAEIKPLHTVPNYCTASISLGTAPRLALSRVEILEELIKQLGTSQNGLTVENIAKFCGQVLEHTSGEVRELSTKILIEMYKLNGNIVRKYVPVDSEMNRRIKKYRILYDAFDTIDGKPLQTYDKNDIVASHTPRFNRSSQVKTPSKSKSRAASLDRKTPMSMADEFENNPDNTCMFCGEVNENFVKQGFEMHYWKSCPMLKQCNNCKQIIEISVQNDHLLTECQLKNNYKRCQRCNEAVNITNQADNDAHFKNKSCTPFEKKIQRCPLCHLNIGSGEEVWKEHLMGPNSCTKNYRKNSSSSNNNSLPVSQDANRKQSVKK